MGGSHLQTPEDSGQDKVSPVSSREVPAHDHTQHGSPAQLGGSAPMGSPGRFLYT